MKKKSTSMVLEANFDIDQLGQDLEWHFSASDEDGNPTGGKNAGSIQFEPEQKFFVRVQGGNKYPFASFKVLDCCLISRPQIIECGPNKPTVFSTPSLFAPKLLGQQVGASLSLAANKFESRQVQQKDPHYFRLTQVWADHLTVVNHYGRWELSFVITVKITREDGSSQLRVFGFDPEAEVGSGTFPPGEGEDKLRADQMLAMETDPEPEVGSGTLPT